MDTFMGRYRNVTFLAAAIFLQILGLAIQIRRPVESEENSSTSSRLIRLWAVSVVAPIEKGIARIQTSTSGIWHNYFYLRGVRQENRDLREQIEKLQLEQVRLKQDAEQARRLQTLLGFKQQFIGEPTAAQVIGTSGNEHSRVVYIDKGSDDGIRNEMPVITADGIVGKVLNVVDGSTSQVLLISDQQSGVGAILEQSRLQGVLKGRASGELVIDKIMTDEDVKPGDRILTSGGDRIFPKGLPVGTVAKVSKGSEFVQLTVKPAAALTHLEEVLVITKKETRDAAASTASPTRAADILAQRLPMVPDKPATPPAQTQAAPNANATGGTPAGVAPGVKKATPAPEAGAVTTPSTTSPAQTTPATKPAMQPTAKPVEAKPLAPETKPKAHETKPATPDSNPPGDTPQ
jgi:rod shape-determining protein MreC